MLFLVVSCFFLFFIRLVLFVSTGFDLLLFVFFFCCCFSRKEQTIVKKEISSDEKAEKKDSNTTARIASSKATLDVSNPLIVMFAIEDYSTGTHGMFVNMEKAAADYYTVMYMMNYKCGYSHVCMVNKSNNDESWKIHHNKKRVKDGSFVKQKYKKHINMGDIEEFNTYIKENILTDDNKYKYDGLIYFISCLGDGDDVIYDSLGEDGNLAFLFDQFNHEECKCLRNKPKIFIIDTSRAPNTKLSAIPKNPNSKAPSKSNSGKKDNNNDNNSNNSVSSGDNKSSDSNYNSSNNKPTVKRMYASEYFCKESDMRFVYATADGYAKVLDKPKYDKKGSNLIRQFCFSIDRKCKDKNLLDDLIYKTKMGVEEKIFKHSNFKETKDINCQVVVDVNRMRYHVNLVPKT